MEIENERERKKKKEKGRFADGAMQQHCRTCYHVKHRLLDKYTLPPNLSLFLFMFAPSLSATLPVSGSRALTHGVPFHTHTLFSHFLLPDLNTSCTFPIQQFLNSPDDTNRFHTSKEHTNNSTKKKKEKKKLKQYQANLQNPNPTGLCAAPDWEADSISGPG